MANKRVPISVYPPEARNTEIYQTGDYRVSRKTHIMDLPVSAK